MAALLPMREQNMRSSLLATWTIVLCAVTTLDEPLSNSAFVPVADKIIASQARIESLEVSCDIHSESDGQERTLSVTYARSGNKEYCKTWWPSRGGEPPNKRYSLVIWNGNTLLAYDSRAHNGSLRSGRNLRAPQEPQTYSEFSRCLGHFTEGSLGDLLKRIPADQWVAKWAEPGTMLSLTCDTIRGRGDCERSEWLLDVKKGFMITKYTVSNRDPSDATKYNQVLEMRVVGSREILPGLWLPTQCHSVYQNAGRRVVNDMRATELAVNSPEIENVFTFKWPEGSQYYDFNLKCTVIPNATDAALEKKMKDMADDIAATPLLPAPEQDIDSMHRAREQEKISLPQVQGVARREGRWQPSSVFLWLALALGGGAAVGMVVVARRKARAKGQPL